MRGVIYFYILLFCIGKVGAQDRAVISGTVEQEGLNKLWLYKVVDGDVVECGRYPVNENRSFRIEYLPEYDGFYTIGHPEKSTMFYMKKGDVVNLRVLEKTNIELDGENSLENEMLFKWHAYADVLLQKAVNWMENFNSTYEDFFPQFEEVWEGLPAFRKTLKSGTVEFDKLLDRVIDYEMDYWAMRYIQTPRSKHPKENDFPVYYREILDRCPIDSLLLKLPFGQNMLRLYQIMAMRFYTKGSDVTEANEKMMAFIQDSRCQELFIVNNVLKGCKGYGEFQGWKEKLGKYLKSRDVITEVDELEHTLKKQDSGVAPDFTYPDVNGKLVSLSDFKGKVVLIDVWATWCGPCQEQIPHLLKLEEELKDTGIVFMGVSLDKGGDKEKWLDMVKDKGLRGVQLFADGWGKITKDYEIKGIPRFIIIGKDGEIVARQAPVPASPVLKQLLLDVLKK